MICPFNFIFFTLLRKRRISDADVPGANPEEDLIREVQKLKKKREASSQQCHDPNWNQNNRREKPDQGSLQ